MFCSVDQKWEQEFEMHPPLLSFQIFFQVFSVFFFSCLVVLLTFSLMHPVSLMHVCVCLQAAEKEQMEEQAETGTDLLKVD